ncbi:MAG TPA: TIGR00725 family protein, partial [Candidatus Limnocylindria bacterium]|nr:TIGR00725 family protein [Candidatus Limnocylindria bacterium]
MTVPRPTVRPPHVAVIGDGDPRGPEAHRILEWAEEVGQLLARGGAVVITGGLGGVMRAASRGATAAGGATLGILPGTDPDEANEFVTTPIATGLGVVRNLVVVTAADVVVAVGGR